MIEKVIGQALMSGMMKRLRGGPQSMLPKSPGAGYGTSSFKGLTPKKTRRFVTPKQNPTMSPGGGVKRMRGLL